MAIIVPIVSEWNPKGLDRSLADIQRAEGAWNKAGVAIKKAAVPAGIALTALTAAAVTFAKAAAEDQKAAAELSRSLQATAGATEAQVAATEEWISAQGRVLGVADDQLRPALATLARATGDVAEAQRLASLAMDISAGTGKDLTSVADGLAKAQAGQLTALKKLIPGFDAAIIASGDLGAAQAELNRLFGGAAATAADTAAGKMQRFSLALTEAQESIGAALLPAMEKLLPYLQAFGEWAQENSQTIVIVGGAIGALAAAVLAARAAMAVYEAATLAASVANRILASSSGTVAGRLGAVRGAAAAAAVTVGVVAAEQAGLTDKFYRNADAVDHNTTAMEKWIVAAGYTIRELVTGQGAAYAFSEEARAMTSATVSAAVAQGELAGASGSLSGALAALGEDTAEAGANALRAAGSYLALWESIAGAARAERDFANTSGTVSSAISQGAILGPNPGMLDKWTSKYGEVAKAAGGAARGTSSVTKAQKEADKYAKSTHLRVIGDVVNGYEITATNLDRLAPKLREKFTKALTAANEAIRASEADRRKALEAATADYEKAFTRISDAVRGAFDIGAIAAEAVKDDGDWKAAWDKQIAHAEWIANVIKALIAQGASEGLVALIASQGANGAALAEKMIRGGFVPQANADLAQVDVWAGEAGTAFADKFYAPGVAGATDLVTGITDYLDSQMAALFEKGRQMGLAISAGMNSTSPSGGGRSVPQVRGRSGSSSVTVNITAGIGDPVAIARQVENVLNTKHLRIGGSY